MLDGAPSELQGKILEDGPESARSATIFGLNQLLDHKDLNTAVHSTRLAGWGVRMAEKLGLDEDYQRDVEVGALLHDIGKIGIPDAVLRKPDRLTLTERELMNKHPEYGWSVLQLFPGFERVSLFALHHHERFDGQGYPEGLMGRQIPLGARIVSVLDAFDAMVSDRCYRPRLSCEEAIKRTVAGSGSQFDPGIVSPFLPPLQAELPQTCQVPQPVQVVKVPSWVAKVTRDEKKERKAPRRRDSAGKACRARGRVSIALFPLTRFPNYPAVG